MTDHDERFAALEARVAETEAEVHRQRMEIVILKAEMEGLRRLPGMNQTRTDRLLPMIALMGTRCRAIEEKILSRDEAAQIHKYWVEALRVIGINPDPLNLEANE